MKIIFLDIDGVLNTSKTFLEMANESEINEKNRVEVDEFRVEFLKRIVDKTGALIVLSSSWESYFNKVSDKIIPVHEKGRKLANIFNKYGIKIYDAIFGLKDELKQEKINIWLSLHEDIESFVIIDDDSYSLTNFIGKYLIKTSYTKDGEMITDMNQCRGLCEDDIECAINILNKRVINKEKVKRLSYL